MSDHHTDQTNQHANSAGGHEASEFSIAPIAWFLIGLTVATVVICLLTAGLFSALKRRDAGSKRSLSPLAAERQKIPPEPRLQLAPSTEDQLEGKGRVNLKQEHPLEEMKRLRREEDSKLKSYGWIDEKAGIVHIPIDEAKKLLIKKGIPTRK